MIKRLEADIKTHYVCQYCQPIMNKDSMPSRCILNGLMTEPVPKELDMLDPLSKQIIQRDKAFQAVFRLGTYTGNVPNIPMCGPVKVSCCSCHCPSRRH